MGFLRDLMHKVEDNPVTRTLNKLDPVSDNITDTITEAVDTGWGKPLGSDKSGLDVLGAGPQGRRGIGGDANKPADRRVGRLVGSIFAAGAASNAASAGVDATATGATSSSGINIGAGSATDAAGGTFTATGATTGSGAAAAGAGITVKDVLTGVEALGAANQLIQASNAGKAAPASVGTVDGGDAGPDTPAADSLQPQVDPDLAAIRKRNAMLFGVDSASSTDLTRGGADMGNIGRVTLLGGSSRLGA